MRAVVITHLAPPDPARDRHGIYRRLGMFVQSIARVCQDVEIVHISPGEDASPASGDQLAEYWGAPVATRRIDSDETPRRWWQAAHSLFGLRYRGGFRPVLGAEQTRALRTILAHRPDMVFAHRLPAMIAAQRVIDGTTPIFFDLDDVEHRVRLRSARSARSTFERWRRLAEIPAVMRAERRALNAAARTFVCSDVDRDYLASHAYAVQRTVVAPNAVPLPARPAPPPPCKSVLFLGNYGYLPNAEAAERLIASIWPKVTARVAGAQLIVAGAHPEKIRAYGAPQPSVEFTGFVSDLDALYARTRMVCCPIENGGGTRVKLIEAAGFGKPIVATPMAAEGLKLEPGRDILLFERDADLAAACVKLLEDDEAARALGQSARRKALSLYAFENIGEAIADDLRGGFASHARDEASLMRRPPTGDRSRIAQDPSAVSSSLEQP